MIKEVYPFKYQGSIEAPRSKSYLQRAIAIAALCEGRSVLTGYTDSNDARVACGIARALGASVNVKGNEVIVDGIQAKMEHVDLFCGEAGLSTRMFSPIAAALSDEVTINGEGSILSRPMDMVIDALEQMKVNVTSNDGFLPLRFSGKAKGGTFHIDGSESSQLLTGLLIALPLLEEDSEIHVKDLKSIPYVQMTLDILKAFGVNISHNSFKHFTIEGRQRFSSREYSVEGDWSGASFHVVGAAISGSIELKGMSEQSAQADKAILDAVEKAGAEISWENEEVRVQKNALNGFEFDATHCPDLFPPLAALAACCEGTTIIKGTDRLTHKESNRALTIQDELAKLGVDVKLEPNHMRIKGGTLKAGQISSRNDHRIAMMGGILAAVTEESILIEDPDAVNKSYPGFYDDLEAIRFFRRSL